MISLASEMMVAMRGHEEILRYWKSLRKSGRLPSRADLNPARIHRRLPQISLIDVAGPVEDLDPGAYRQRLAGTELFGIYGREITGLSLERIYGPEDGEYWSRELRQIVETRKPNVGLCPVRWLDVQGVYMFWLRLPLAADGVNVDMVLGHDAFIGRQDIAVSSGIRAA